MDNTGKRMCSATIGQERYTCTTPAKWSLRIGGWVYDYCDEHKVSKSYWEAPDKLDWQPLEPSALR
jgi:hypothetical protein